MHGQRASDSDGLLRDIVEEIPLRVFWKDLTSRYLGCNSLFARDAGCASPAEVIGRTDDELGWRDQAPDYQADDRVVMASGEPKIAFEERQTSPSGALLWLRTSKVPLRDAGGAVIGVLGIYEDITERKAIELQLHDSERRFQRLFEGSPDPCWIIDRANRFCLCNEAAARVLGYDAVAEVVSRHPSEHSPARQPDGSCSRAKADEMMAIAHEKGVHRFEWVHRRRNGEEFPVEVTLAEIETGGEKQLYCIWRDISERKRYESALLETRARHEEAQRIAGLGHWRFDLRSGDLDWSDEVYRIFDLPRRDGTMQEGVFSGCIHPDDRQRVADAYEAAVRDRTRYDVEHRIVTPGGAVKWVQERGETTYGADGAPLYSTGTVLDVTARIEASSSLRASNAFLGGLIARAAEGISVCFAKAEFPFVEFSVWNDRMTEITGYTMEEINRLGWYQTMYPEPALQARAVERMARMREGDDLVAEHWQVVARDGTRRTLSISTSMIELADGTPAVIGLMQDVTEMLAAQEERARWQQQLQVGQRLEAIGRLAGGVAHDFNNMLGVILGCVELALGRLAPSDAAQPELKEIQDAAQRSADLTRQLLAFASQQVTAPELFDVNAKVVGMLRMLTRIIGENVRLSWTPGGGACLVRMDPSQFDQILANLCVNARDAIVGVGNIRITTQRTEFATTDPHRHPGLAPGGYVVLTFADDGCGMSPEVLEHVFEPFFTTKSVGRGTGLGLATVYGIVRQSGGHVEVVSAVGKGTTFTLFLPLSLEAAVPSAGPSPAGSERGNAETVLLVEDEPSVRRVTCRMLEGLGYHVLSAASPAGAEALAGDHGGSIDLLVTDVVMPGGNGCELAQRLGSRIPSLRTLFMSGYTAGTLPPGGECAAEAQFLAKPFTSEGLARAVRAALATARS
ncbi:MAG: PAS domain S-box protein [Planctomycetota bacterium]